MNTELQGRKVALVGGAGFIGHNLALSLIERGAEVTILDSLQVNNLLWFHSQGSDTRNRDLYLSMINQRLDMMRQAGATLLVVDARDYQVVWRMLDQVKPHVVVHLAAVSHAGRSNKDPFTTFDHSFRTLENCLDACKIGVDHFIFLSSSMVYGDFLTDSVDEEHPLNCKGIYGALKVGGEKLVIAYEQVFGLPYTIIRPSALYGPRCVSRRVVQVFVENALHGLPLRINGDGAEKLDFTYVDDLVDGICLVIEKPEARNQIFNLTYGDARSIEDLASIIRYHFPQVDVENIERDKLLPFRGTLSIDKARALLGYAPRHDLEIGCEKYLQWYRSFDACSFPRAAAV